MPRPKKCRRVCHMPAMRSFGPLDTAQTKRESIGMSVDEFETVRLIDLEGLSQEACAIQMHVARTTVQAIYGSARTKLAACLVRGLSLEIGGGEYILCKGEGCGCACCNKKRCRSGDEENE